MNKRTVNISSLVLLLSLLSFLLEITMYYFIPNRVITILAASVISITLSHFFLETSMEYNSCFLHGSFMTITAVAFTVIVYLLQPNRWITYDYSMLALVLLNWIIPFGYCFFRDFFDRGPRFANYTFFFHGMSVVFLVIYFAALIKQLFITPVQPPYEELTFGAHNFVPFMASGEYLETTLNADKTIQPMITYLLEMIAFFVPFGFYAKVYTRRFSFFIRLIVYAGFPFILEFLQSITGIGRAHIDDYSLAVIGTLLGILIYTLVYKISYHFHKRDFLEDRTITKSLLFHFGGNL